MKIIDKNQLKIERKNDGTISLEFSLGANYQLNPYEKKALLVNGITNEMEEFGNLILFAEGNDLFLYPYKYRNSRKRENNYMISNWVFKDDSRFDKIVKNIANNKKAKQSSNNEMSNNLWSNNTQNRNNKSTIHLNVSDSFRYIPNHNEEYISASVVNEFIKNVQTALKEMGELIDNVVDSNIEAKYKYREKEKEVQNSIIKFNQESAKLNTQR